MKTRKLFLAQTCTSQTSMLMTNCHPYHYCYYYSMVEKNNAFSSLSLSSLPSPLPKQRKEKILWLTMCQSAQKASLAVNTIQHSKGEKLYVPQLLRRRRREMLLRLRILLNSSAPSPPPPAPRGPISRLSSVPPLPIERNRLGRSLWDPGLESLHPSLRALQGQGSHARPQCSLGLWTPPGPPSCLLVYNIQ